MYCTAGNVWHDNFAISSHVEVLTEKFTQNKNLVVFGALSQMVKVQGACDKPFWIYTGKR